MSVAKTAGALDGLLKRAVRAPGAKKPAPQDTSNEDRKQARLAALREFRSAKSDEEALEAFDAFLESR